MSNKKGKIQKLQIDVQICFGKIKKGKEDEVKKKGRRKGVREIKKRNRKRMRKREKEGREEKT